MIDIGIHTSLDENVATVDHGENVCWLKINSGNGSLSIYGKMHQLPALKMMADIFNDNFGPTAKPAPIDWSDIPIPFGESAETVLF